jgi:glutamine synthetase
MVRIPPERGMASRMELRLGDSSANPYLAIAALLAGAYIGIQQELSPPDPLEGYGYDPEKSPMLPSDLGTALTALEDDHELIDAFLTHVRNGVGASELESAIIRDVVSTQTAAERDGAARRAVAEASA